MQERRHAAIMFTDIVGYTGLIGSDKGLAFEALRKNREIHGLSLYLGRDQIYRFTIIHIFLIHDCRKCRKKHKRIYR